jgi:extradiol dioxygenase family protein
MSSVPPPALPPFHLAVPVHDIEAARRFYGEVLGLERGRSDKRWTDWNVCLNLTVVAASDAER